mmetsp:Transcript_108234/g.241623  ORF Transcript_108234/g.241623 Transcript_108234/m.241623 type:complete len:705 (-) Transcript_108234:178-2292(-)
MGVGSACGRQSDTACLPCIPWGAMGQVCPWHCGVLGASQMVSGNEGAPTTASVQRTQGEADGKVGPLKAKIRDGKLVMGKYRMHMEDSDIMGEGTSSICRRGTDIETGEPVAIKVYKTKSKQDGGSMEVMLTKYRRQIQVLQDLLKPLQKPSNPRLWHDALESAKPSKLFMQLVDYSKEASGNPGPDTSDGIMYVVTELGQYSLKDYFKLRRTEGKPLSKETVREIAKAIILVTAGLHAKGLVHLDLKPENLMLFNGSLKLIDVDGCVKIGAKVSIDDFSLSFSPCYCAPEWARFLIDDCDDPTIIIDAGLDVWSIGMTICELVTMDAVLKPVYASFLKHGRSQRQAGFLFMEWLSSIRKCPLPKLVEKNCDAGMLDLLRNWLLVCNHQNRKTCAQCLSNPYIAQGGWDQKETTLAKQDNNAPVQRQMRDRQEDTTGTLAPLHKGTLWKLTSDAKKDDMKDPSKWIKRDMWIAHNHSLCYYSVKENKRLVLIDGDKLTKATMQEITGGARNFAFEVSVTDAENDINEKQIFACESEDERKLWIKRLSLSAHQDMIVTFQLGEKIYEELQAFRMTVKNRRIKVDDNAKDQFEPIFKAKLWKVKAEGDRKKKEDWFLRDMWLAKNGSLVYWSEKESRDLIYYTAADIARASTNKLGDGDAAYPFAFQLQLPPVDGVEFSPGEFAAISEEERSQWLAELKKFVSREN